MAESDKGEDGVSRGKVVGVAITLVVSRDLTVASPLLCSSRSRAAARVDSPSRMYQYTRGRCVASRSIAWRRVPDIYPQIGEEGSSKGERERES